MTIEELQKEVEELKKQLKKEPEIFLKHNHSGGDYMRIKFDDLFFKTQSGTTKTTPGTVDGWLEIRSGNTIYYIPAYTSKTS